MTRKILLIEDELDIAELLSLHLADIGAEVTHADEGVRGLTLALQNRWDLILLDLTLPRCDGLDICQQIRQSNPVTPIIMVTARTSEADRIRGLEIGADDYVTKPFSVSELMARIKAMFRRVEAIRQSPEPGVISVSDIVLNPDTHVVHIDGKPVSLTVKEFDLLNLQGAYSSVLNYWKRYGVTVMTDTCIQSTPISTDCAPRLNLIRVVRAT